MTRHKYSAVRTVVDGISFASKAEARRYSELRRMEMAGEISGLTVQPKYPLPAGIKYVADFMYLDREGRAVVEDVKGVRTPVYRLKLKLFKFTYPDLVIYEVGKKGRVAA